MCKMEKPKFLAYSLNDDGTYSLSLDMTDGCCGYKIDIPRIEITWEFPPDINCFTLPVPVEFNILATVERNMLKFTLPDKN